MSSPYDLIMQAAAAASTFPQNSRYYGTRTAILEQQDGQKIVYLRRRFVPPPEQFETVVFHSVVQGDRLDNIAAEYFGDPELVWRLCDANNIIRPDKLLEKIGSRIRITMPQGIPGQKYG